jgi:O-antigen/teichoic acid export membrane protein
MSDTLMRNRHWIRWLPEPIRNKLSGRTNLQAILANSGWLIFDKIIRIFFGLFVGAWLARYLGPAQYGELAYALAYIAIFQAITTLGLDEIIVREISQNKTPPNQILGTCFLLRLVIGIICWLVAVISIACINGWMDPSVWIIALAGGSLIFQAADTVDLWLQSQSRSRYTVFAKISACIIANSIKILLILYNAPLLAFAAVIALEASLISIGLFFVYRKYPVNGRWQPVWLQAKNLLQESWPLMISSLSTIIYMRIDQIIIKELLGMTALGIYAVIQPVALATNFLPILLNISIMPTMSRIAQAEDKTAYNKTLINIFRLYFFTSLFLAISISLLSGEIVNLLYGSQFIEAGEILKVYVFASCFTWLGVAHTLWLINERKSKLRLYGTLISVFVCVVANCLFLEKFGIIFAAWIAIATQFIAACGINIFLAKKTFLMQIEAIFFIKTRTL